jgi:uncharacterized protein YgbK (DUF1537 family)
MTPLVRILADDLSGAADCAASFTGAVGPMSLLLHGEGAGQVQFALDADTRVLEAGAAAERWRALGRASARDRESLLFKKVDSTLRGHIAEELGAFVEALPHLGTIVVAPAFPAQGRTFVNGRLSVHGAVTGASLAPVGEALRSGLEEPRAVVLADAIEQADLEALVQGMGGPDPATLWVGSAGLARALAGAPPSRIEPSALRGPLLIVCGSYSAAARAQAAALVRELGDDVVVTSAAGEPSHDAAAAAARALRSHGVALVRLDPETTPAAGSRAMVRSLSTVLRAVASRCGTLALTGGDTARAMLEALEVIEIFVEGELEPGIAVTAPIEPHGFRVALKAGGFGDEDTWVRLARPVMAAP